jgi:hypothetical protein
MDAEEKSFAKMEKAEIILAAGIKEIIFSRHEICGSMSAHEARG